jgi:hypothetical protein
MKKSSADNNNNPMYVVLHSKFKASGINFIDSLMTLFVCTCVHVHTVLVDIRFKIEIQEATNAAQVSFSFFCTLESKKYKHL